MAIKLTGMASQMDTDSMVKELVSAYSLKKENYVKDKTKLDWQQEAWKDLNSKIYSFYTGALSKMKMAASFSNQKTVTVSDPTKATVTANSKVPNGTQTIDVQRLARAGYLTGAKTSLPSGQEIDANKTKMDEFGLNGQALTVNVKGADKIFTIYGSETVSEFSARFKKETGVSATFDSDQKRFIFNTESGTENDFNFKAADTTALSTLAKLGIATADQYTALGQAVPAQVAFKQEAVDSKILVNGAEYISGSNKILVNGMTINATQVSNGAITVTTAMDTNGIYDMVKNFYKEYNDIINDLTSSYNAVSAKGYEPLSDDEKESMTDDQIEKWEKKIKDSLFRRDDTLGGVMNTITAAIEQGVKIDGKTYHGTTFGIATLGFLKSETNKQNAFHIDGDKDDSVTSAKTDKLRAAIEENPELVSQFMNGLATNVYDALTKKMSSTSLRSAYTLYNDKAMKEEQKDLESTIKDWDKKIKNYEDYWYKKFTEMEKSMTKLNSQTSQLTQLLGK